VPKATTKSEQENSMNQPTEQKLNSATRKATNATSDPDQLSDEALEKVAGGAVDSDQLSDEALEKVAGGAGQVSGQDLGQVDSAASETSATTPLVKGLGR
jgi:hypothetical protein